MTAPATPAAAAEGDQADDNRGPGFRLRRYLAGGIVLLALVTGWALAYETTQKAAASAERAAQMQDVVSALRGVTGAMYRAEAAHRDHLFLARDAELQAYRTAADSVRREIAVLRAMADESARPDVDHLASQVGARIALLDEVAGRRETGNIDTALAPVYTGAGAALALEIGKQIAELERNEERQLSVQERGTQVRRRNSLLLLIGNGLFTVLVVVGLVGVFTRDLKRRERHEQELRLALHAADAASEAKTQFLATVSHEIRTPLNAVSGMSELLLETKLDTEQTEFVRAVHANANALAMLIGDLLDESRIEAGEVFFDSAPFDVRELVESVADILVVRADVKGVELVVDLPLEGPRRFVGDRNRVRQVLMNLVGNAVKFTEKGQVVITGAIDPGTDGASARLCLRVIDSGIGIAREAQQRVFERFVQAEGTTARRYGGSGLGLHISRSLVELMGGTISLQSAVDRGSTFEVELTLPLAPTQPPPDVQRSSLAGVDVLLIQPNVRLSESIAHALEFAGASVRSVATAEEGMARLAEAPARVIVVGERIADATGVEFSRKLWHGHGNGAEDANVVLLCSLRDTGASFIGSYGIAACVYKPVKQARVVQAVRVAAGLDVEVASKSAPAAPATVRVAPLRILMVEDSRDNWMLASHILTTAGYAVDRAEDGLSAVNAAAAFAFDLILMDIELPGIDGMEATRRIRAIEQASGPRRAPIVALTAHAVEAVRREAISAGMDDYVTKPISKETLLEACRRWIDGRYCLLIVDDAPEIHVLVANYLRGSEYHLIDVFSGRDAVAAFVSQRVSLVLVDSVMAGMDGRETVQAIRQTRGGADVPIIALTGDDTEQQRRFAEEWCDASLVKPVRRNDLLATIARHLGVPASRRQRPPGTPAAPPPPGQPERRGTGTRLPTARDASSQVHRLLALRDFAGLAGFAESLRATAEALEISKLAAVSQELIDAARTEDVPRSDWWGDQIAPAVHDAQRLIDARMGSVDRRSYYDSLAHLATSLMHGFSAVLTLVRDERVRIRGGANLPAFLDTGRDIPLMRSLTRFAVIHGAPLVVDDVRADPRVQDAAAITAHEIVSFVAVPLRNADGVGVGAFGVMDRRPRHWPPEEVAVLEELASVAMRMIELEDAIEARSPAATSAAPAGDAAADSAPAAAATAAHDVVTVEDDIADLLPGYVAAQRQIVETLIRSIRRAPLMLSRP